jgi:hypothetical protein
MSLKAARWGTAVGYTNINGQVTIEMNTGRVAVISEGAFNRLYYKLDDFTAALKEDCIEYAINNDSESLFAYPLWYVDAFANGIMYRVDGVDYFNGDDKNQDDIAMAPGSFILRNHKGQLMYMESDQFDRYYDMVGREME